MLQKVFVIVLSVAIFGVLFFFYVKRALKKRLDFYLNKNNKNKKIQR